jgi:hypothetical protein
MSQSSDRQRQLAAALKRMKVVEGVKGAELRCWSEGDFPAIQRLSALEGWTTSQRRPEESKGQAGQGRAGQGQAQPVHFRRIRRKIMGMNSTSVSRYDIMVV